VALHCTVPAALPSKGLVAAERASRSRRLNTSTSPGSSRRMAFASSGLSVRAPEDFSLKIFPQHSGERRHKPVSLVSARLHKLALWTYTLPCAPGGYALSEQIKTTGPDAGKALPSRKRRTGLLVGLIGGVLTAGAVLFTLNGGAPLLTKNPTLALVVPAEIGDASKTLDPASSDQLVARAKECSVPLAQIAIWKIPGTSGGTIRIRSGNYTSPPFNLTEAPQRVAIPFPAPYPTGRGVISVEGVANGAVISISPAWHIDSLGGSTSLDVVWTPDRPC
jgi:hypothetical protein